MRIEGKVEKMEEKEKKVKKSQKNNLLIFILVAIIIILSITLGVVLLHEKTEKASSKQTTDNTEVTKPEKQDTKEESKEKENTSENVPQLQPEETTENLSLDNPMVIEVAKLNPKALCGQTTLELEKRNRSIQEISDIEKMRMIVSYYASKTPFEEELYVGEDSIKRYFADISFLQHYANGVPKGEDLGYTYYDDVRYENNQLALIHKYGSGCEGPSQGNFLRLYSAKKGSKRLYVNYAKYYIEADHDGKDEEGNYYFIFKYYKDSTKEEYLGEGKEYTDLDPQLFSGYQFVFNIENGYYQLEGINYLAHVTEG